ncbi:MAG: adenylate/guanylate cyclase domain-containing protein [Cyclobacteriaceae bacterium]|nr:adenylate/guanylate cyclase domain-containing protein [Cyclobacteriaceae bacterium HetDA_MAG_MS6]
MIYKLLALGDRYPKQADFVLLILGFSLGANFFMLLKFEELEEIRVMLDRSHFDIHLINPSLSGILIGLGINLLESRIIPKINMGYWFNILLRFVLFSLLILGCIALVHMSSSLLFSDAGFFYSIHSYLFFINTPLFFTLYIYLLMLGISINFFRVIGNLFGHGIIFNYVMGKYREPIEENRIFMFLDLNDSTRIAEKLGHVKYSRFLNKCFTDLSEVLPMYDGEIYQYVGDEAVITWNLDTIKNPLKPIWLYKAYEEKLDSKSDEYLEKFGVTPYFKAAINSGVVSVSMVGGRKKEMAFHGDVLNTASRVLEQCGKLSKSLLITQSFSEAISGNPKVTAIRLKEVFLRGKNDMVAIYQPILHL